MESMKNIIVTGANGFTGSHILESFRAVESREYEVIAACRSKAKLPDIFQANARIGDLKSGTYLENLTQNAAVICHTAAWAEMNGSVEDSSQNFLQPGLNLIDAALKNGVKRFVFLSAITSHPIRNNGLHSKRDLAKIWPHYASIIAIENHLERVAKRGMQVVILRVGYFTGKNYALGLLPILLPRLKTHLVPWIEKGRTTLPLINGADIGLAFRLAATRVLKEPFYVMDIIGNEVPSVREVFVYLHEKYKYPLPHFSVSFKFAYGFARLMQCLHKFVPGDPLIVPAIVLLLEETGASN
ncbi:MAG TPA: NAD(P)-dependent oxidoreductase, partial [Bacteroidetes bacterium]|nr:NAD(P)-dependent oxidoreductase [Bacteroidota bacterium]